MRRREFGLGQVSFGAIAPSAPGASGLGLPIDVGPASTPGEPEGPTDVCYAVRSIYLAGSPSLRVYLNSRTRDQLVAELSQARTTYSLFYYSTHWMPRLFASPLRVMGAAGVADCLVGFRGTDYARRPAGAHCQSNADCWPRQTCVAGTCLFAGAAPTAGLGADLVPSVEAGLRLERFDDDRFVDAAEGWIESTIRIVAGVSANQFVRSHGGKSSPMVAKIISILYSIAARMRIANTTTVTGARLHPFITTPEWNYLVSVIKPSPRVTTTPTAGLGAVPTCAQDQRLQCHYWIDHRGQYHSRCYCTLGYAPGPIRSQNL